MQQKVPSRSLMWSEVGLSVATRLSAEAVLSCCLSRVKLITGGVTPQETAATTVDPLHTQQHATKGGGGKSILHFIQNKKWIYVNLSNEFKAKNSNMEIKCQQALTSKEQPLKKLLFGVNNLQKRLIDYWISVKVSWLLVQQTGKWQIYGFLLLLKHPNINNN